MAAYKDLVGQKITKVTSNPGEPKTGQMWYNSTTGNLKGLGILEAWSSASNLVNVRRAGFGAGTQTAGLAAFGRSPSAPIGSFSTSEEYDGTGWAFGGTANTARFSMAGSGTQTAAVGSGGYNPPGSPAFVFAATEEYDGSSWTSTGNLSTGRSGCAGFGIQTAAVNVSGYTAPGSVTGAAEHYNGSSWTSGGSLNTTTQKTQGSCGTQTAGLAWGGDPPGPATGSNVTELYNGSTWTTGNTTNINRSYTTRAGTQTDAVCAGGYGQITTTETFDGTSWSTSPATLGTGNQDFAGADGTSTAAFACGGNLGPTFTSATEEYNKSTNAITGAAWASGGALNQARYQMAGAGTQTAGLAFGGYGPAETGKTEEYDGTSWSEQNDMGTARYEMANGNGTQTAALCTAGRTDTAYGGGAQSFVEEYDGTSWSEVNNLPSNRIAQGSCGPQTATVAALGATAPGAPNITNTSFEYDGTNWTAGNTANTARSAAFAAGTQTSAIFAGGSPSLTAAEEYNGTSFANTGSLLVGAQGANTAGADSDAALFTSGGNGTAASGVDQTQSYNGSTFSTAPILSSKRGYAAGFGTQTAAVVGGGLRTAGVATTEEFTGETTAGNVTDFTTS